MMAIVAVLLVVILFVSVYAVLAISALDSQVTFLTGETGAQASQLTGLEQEVVALQSQVSKLQQGVPTGFSFVLQYVCVSATPDCNGDAVYLVQVANNGSKTYPASTPVLISFQLNASSYQVAINSSISGALAPGHNTLLSSASWPQYSDFGSRISSGNVVKVSVSMGGEVETASAVVLTCSTTTTTFQNATVVQTATMRNCS